MYYEEAIVSLAIHSSRLLCAELPVIATVENGRCMLQVRSK